MIRIKGNKLLAIEISQWLKEQGLKHSHDYSWHQMSIANQITNESERYVVFDFADPKWESIIALRWS